MSETKISEMEQKLADFETRERALKEEMHQLELMQQELANIREKLHDQEVCIKLYTLLRKYREPHCDYVKIQVKGFSQEQAMASEQERHKEMEREMEKLEQQLEEKDVEVMTITRELQAQKHHTRNAEDKVKLHSS